MIRLIRTERLKEMERACETQAKECEEQAVILSELKDENCHLNKTVARLKMENEAHQDSVKSLLKRMDEIRERLRELESPYGKEDTVTLTISDDFSRVTPVVRFNTETREKMVVDGLITEKADHYSAQLALISICSEALSQMIAQFTEEVEEGSDDA